MRYRRSLSIIIATISAAGMVGCALPQHSNTLLFATNTVVALDVSTNATTAAPNITLGYKRQEMARVPLLANQTGPTKERQPAECPKGANANATDPCVFLGRDSTSVDAYSVLATFAGSGAASRVGERSRSSAAQAYSSWLKPSPATNTQALRTSPDLMSTHSIGSPA
jgi:hypothetical protein